MGILGNAKTTSFDENYLSLKDFNEPPLYLILCKTESAYAIFFDVVKHKCSDGIVREEIHIPIFVNHGVNIAPDWVLEEDCIFNGEYDYRTYRTYYEFDKIRMIEHPGLFSFSKQILTFNLDNQRGTGKMLSFKYSDNTYTFLRQIGDDINVRIEEIEKKQKELEMSANSEEMNVSTENTAADDMPLSDSIASDKI